MYSLIVPTFVDSEIRNMLCGYKFTSQFEAQTIQNIAQRYLTCRIGIMRMLS